MTDFAPLLSEVRIESNTNRRELEKTENGLARKSDRNDNSTRSPQQCDQDDLYSCWKREKSLCEKWQEAEREVERDVEREVGCTEMETRDLRENVMVERRCCRD